MTYDTAAVEKQKVLIDRLHEKGASVLMSSHIFHFVPAEKVLEIALAHQSRGADIAKIVVGAENEDEDAFHPVSFSLGRGMSAAQTHRRRAWQLHDALRLRT